MKRSALFFFPSNPYPPQRGNHWRCLQMLAALKRLGLRVVLAGIESASDRPWTAPDVEQLRATWADDVRIYRPTTADLLHIGLVQHRYMRRDGAACATSAAEAAFLRALELYAAPDMRAWFAQLYEEERPGSVFVSSVAHDGLVDHGRMGEAASIMDSNDLWSVNLALQYAVAQYFPAGQLDPWSISDEVLSERFMRDLGLQPHDREFEIYDTYDHTIAITASEARLMRERTWRTRVAHIPLVWEPCYHPNHYSGAALFACAPYILNTQGLVYFIRKVLPLVREQAPDFALLATGSLHGGQPPPVPNVTFAGFIPDLAPVFARSRFAICPLLCGTGQKVKIVEAMAHGLPVIATAHAAEGSPIRHGINGFVAATAHDFAGYVAHLWQDTDRCRAMGQAARATIADAYSERHLVDLLRPLV